MTNKDCKYCADRGEFPDYSEALRKAIKNDKWNMATDLFQSSLDPKFKKIHEAEYCCNSARYDAEEKYNRSSGWFKEPEFYYKEPRIHSHITDVLPEKHYLANETVYCKTCTVMVHCDNNECMRTWIETGVGNYCLKCFMALSIEEHHEVLDDEYALEVKFDRTRKEKINENT